MPPPATTERAGRGSALHRVGLLAAAAVLATACGAPPAPEGRVAPGLEQVRSHVGVEPSESRFWEQQPLRGRLEHLLGERLPTLVACLEAAGPLEEDSGVVHAFGAVEVAGGLHGAVLLVDPARDVVNVRLKINRAVQELHEDGVDLPTPEPVAAFFRSIDERLFAESRALGPSAEDDSPPAGDGPAPPVPGPPAATVHVGYFEIGPDVQQFLPCGSFRRTWIVNETDADLAGLRDRLGVKPYEPFFVEMRGRLAAASPERADLGYEVEVELVEILRARPGGTGPECE